MKSSSHPRAFLGMLGLSPAHSSSVAGKKTQTETNWRLDVCGGSPSQMILFSIWCGFVLFNLGKLSLLFTPRTLNLSSPPLQARGCCDNTGFVCPVCLVVNDKCTREVILFALTSVQIFSADRNAGFLSVCFVNSDTFDSNTLGQGGCVAKTKWFWLDFQQKSVSKCKS